MSLGARQQADCLTIRGSVFGGCYGRPGRTGETFNETGWYASTWDGIIVRAVAARHSASLWKEKGAVSGALDAALSSISSVLESWFRVVDLVVEGNSSSRLPSRRPSPRPPRRLCHPSPRLSFLPHSWTSLSSRRSLLCSRKEVVLRGDALGTTYRSMRYNSVK